MSLNDALTSISNSMVDQADHLIDHTTGRGFVGVTAVAIGGLAWLGWKMSNPHRGQDPRPAGNTGTALLDLGDGLRVRIPVRVPAARPDAGTTVMLSASATQTNRDRDGRSAYDVVGVEAIRTAVDQFYALVNADQLLRPYFATVDRERLHRHQALFIGQLWGGPVHFDLDELVTAHRRLHISATAYWRSVAALMAVLTRMQVPDWICQFTLSALYDVRDKVINERPDCTAGCTCVDPADRAET